MDLKSLLLVPLLLGCDTLERRPVPDREDIVIQQAIAGVTRKGFNNRHESGIELRGADGGYKLRPIIGVSQYGGFDEAWFAYGGVRYEIALGKAWTLGPSLGMGYYDFRDNEMDLGGHLQFRPAIDLVYSVTDDVSIGFGWTHISNASLHEENPGLDSLMFSVVWSF